VSQYSYVAFRLIDLHQVPYETVASPLQAWFAWALYMSIYTIVTNYNEPLAPAQAHIHVAVHINVSQYSYIALQYIGLRNLHQVPYETVASLLEV